MPDLMTHVVMAQGFRRVGMISGLSGWFLIGTVLPDLLTRPVNLIFPGLYWAVLPFHTPIGLLLVCAFVSRLVSLEKQRGVFFHLIGGVGLHLFLDLFQKHLGAGYRWFFPFDWSSAEIGLLWPETSLYLFPVWLVLVGFWARQWELWGCCSQILKRVE